ncbi:epiphycan-like isoform X1 [Polyodon spathula]|uniref:epiphycan-like isoform X1 n=2 Tax=Polyodon spathula TaxID=7913 RepID=UPI001B7E1273|nr:epiphycan-like isoform X1 [Polyodon spathula]
MMKQPLICLALALSLLEVCLCAPPRENYHLTGETDWENIDLNNYGDLYDYEDLESVVGERERIEVGTVAPPPKVTPASQNVPPPETPPPDLEEEVPLRPRSTTPPPRLDFAGPGLFGPQTGLGLPTCLLCVCLSTSVYCDDVDLEYVPPLPKDTTYFYARFNKITRVGDNDFLNLNKLKRIDLTGNHITELDEDAFLKLPALQELLLAENKIRSLPELPVTMRYIDARNNQLLSAGIRPEAFKGLTQLEFLYLSYNRLDFIPIPLPESLRSFHIQHNNIQTMHRDTFCNRHDTTHQRKALEDIRLDGNPINLSHFPQAYFCLPRLPTGRMQ